MINLNATLLIQLVNFLLLMFLLNRLLFRPMFRILEERRERTDGRKRLAEKANAEADSLWEDYQRELQQAKADADRARLELVQQAEAERQRMTEEASAQADKTVSEIRARVRAEAEQARKALRAETEKLADSMAQRILGRTVR